MDTQNVLASTPIPTVFIHLMLYNVVAFAIDCICLSLLSLPISLYVYPCRHECANAYVRACKDHEHVDRSSFMTDRKLRMCIYANAGDLLIQFPQYLTD